MKYKVHNITQNITAVVVKNDYDRAMLFCRVQEFYESAGAQFRGKKFSIWSYFEWYQKKYKKGCFSYPSDFVGFNLPLIVAKKCYQLNEIETPYDKIMCGIIDQMWSAGERKYIIGVDSLNNSTFDHEIAHALYYTNLDYKNTMDQITSDLNKNTIKKFKSNLSKIGYCGSVMKDEIQAYMATEINKKITRGIPRKKQIHGTYKAAFKKFKPC